MEPLQKQEHENAPKPILTPEVISIMLTECKALRDEIIKGKKTQHQFTSFPLITLSTVIAFGLQTKNATLTLLYPILAMFLPIADHPHIWGTDELKRKSPDGVLASEAISS